MAGDARTGVSVMRVTAGLDSGPVALREEVAIGPEDDFEALSGKLAGLGGELLVEALDLQAEGELEFEEQDEDEATYAEKIDPAERRLDPAPPGGRAGAHGPRPDARTSAPTWRPPTASGSGCAGRAPVDVSVKTGEVQAEWGALLLGCGRGALRLEVVQPPGGKPMAADAYLRGHPLPKLS